MSQLNLVSVVLLIADSIFKNKVGFYCRKVGTN